MSSFLKKFFKDDTEEVTKKEEDEIINIISHEIMAENSIVQNNKSVDTNKLTHSNIDAVETYKSFSRYMFFCESNTGMVRESNQDSIFTGEYEYWVSNNKLKAGMAIVADGMGGLSLGEVASSTAIASVSTYMCARLSEYIQESFKYGLPHSKAVLGHINDAIRNSNTIVWDKGRSLGESIGTTFTCTFLIGNVAYFGHVGDSRAYIINTENKTIEKVTRDHSLVGRLIEMGNITEKEAKNHPRRNEIYRMLGLRDQIEVDTYYRLIDKNTILVLMSDGLWEFVDDNEILDSIVNGKDLNKSVKDIIQVANKNGGLDNISLILIKPIE